MSARAAQSLERGEVIGAEDGRRPGEPSGVVARSRSGRWTQLIVPGG